MLIFFLTQFGVCLRDYIGGEVMFEEDLLEMEEEEQEEAIAYMVEYLELCALGDGDYIEGSDGELLFD